ncbi:MAG: TSUP family transporter [Clostridia bacterium]|nr:TSUP family transporter [Clostridia bacterium]
MMSHHPVIPPAGRIQASPIIKDPWHKKAFRHTAMALAGLANGILGTGGGLLVIPLLRKRGGNTPGCTPQQAQATAQAVVWPMCLLSAVIYCWRGDADVTLSLWVAGGLTVGAAVGALWLKKWKSKWLDGFLAAVLLYTGIRMIFAK